MNMGNLNKLALTAQEALQQTIVIAFGNESSQAEPIHMLKALLESQENNLSAIIKRIGADPFQLRANVDAEIERMPKVSGNPMMMAGAPGPALMNLIDNAVKIAEKLGDSYATSEHLLIALSEDKGPAGKILGVAGVTRKNIEAAYDELRGDTRVTDPQEKAQFEALERDGQNLTQQAREGKLDPVIGRDEEIRRTIQVLVAPHEEQPRAHRRARRRQDGHRRRAGAAHRGRRRAVSRSRTATSVVAGPGRHDGRREVPRRVRRPPEGGAARGQAERGQHHPVHRRAAHHRGRRIHRATARWMRATCSSLLLARGELHCHRCNHAATNTASTSKRMRRSNAGSSRSWWVNPRWRTPSPSCAA